MATEERSGGGGTKRTTCPGGRTAGSALRDPCRKSPDSTDSSPAAETQSLCNNNNYSIMPTPRFLIKCLEIEIRAPKCAKCISDSNCWAC